MASTEIKKATKANEDLKNKDDKWISDDLNWQHREDGSLKGAKLMRGGDAWEMKGVAARLLLLNIQMFV